MSNEVTNGNPVTKGMLNINVVKLILCIHKRRCISSDLLHSTIICVYVIEIEPGELTDDASDNEDKVSHEKLSLLGKIFVVSNDYYKICF